MTGTLVTTPTPGPSRTGLALRFAGHYLEMVLAMGIMALAMLPDPFRRTS